MYIIIKYFYLYLISLLVSTALATETTEDTSASAGTSSSSSSPPPPPRIVASIEVEIEGQLDKHDSCADWAQKGECEANPTYMLKDCAGSCGTKSKATAYVSEGEDAAMGAFRFAEDYHLVGESATPLVLDVARKLNERIAQGNLRSDHDDDDHNDDDNDHDNNDHSNYTPPAALTHCKNRLCSAGKLWKRAEDMRKEDMHDAAGADLIRALLKTGIEVDFIERCQRSLQWALGSITRQREREKREAIEEEKLEKRREDERAAMEEARIRKEEYEADFVKFGVALQESLLVEVNPPKGTADTATIGADGTVEIEDDEEEEEEDFSKIITKVKETFVQEGPQGGNWNDTVQWIKKVPLSAKTTEILLIEARCHEMLGNHKSALSAAGRLVQKAANYDPWVNDSPRMMAATLGANAAMQLGLSENALSFYQTVLKFDPEQARARKQYRGLKKVVKLMGKAEEQIQKGYNKAASVHVDDCLSAMRGLDVDSPLFRSKIQLKQCTILSGMGKHEEALENCDTAVELRTSNDSVSAASRKEAHLARAEALLLDMDYDEAVQDFRAAFDLVPEDDETGEKMELQQKLQQTMQQQEEWNGGKKDYRFNENTGYPDGMPPQRDHAKILQLPIDLENRDKEIKCAWLKKQFKALVRKFHPDKYKGNKKRAARKFKEVKEAKEIISKEWAC